MQPAVIGLDIGTTSVSAAAISAAGAQIATATRPHNALVTGLPDGYVEQSPQLLWATAVQLLHELTSSLPDHHIVAVGVTGQMHSTILLDEHGHPIGNVITWRDQRALTTQANGSRILDGILMNLSDEATHSTGCRLAAGYTGATVAAMKQLGEWPDGCQRISFVADWITSQLTGLPTVTDRTHAASSGLYDLKNDRWNSELLDATGVGTDLLPEVRDSGTPIGRVSETASKVTGIPQQAMVCNAIGDHQAAMLSTIPDDDSILINIGTGGQIAWRVPEFVRIENMETRYLPDITDSKAHGFLLVGAGACGGHSYTWINKTVRSWLNAFGIERTESEIWQKLSQQPHQPMSDGLTCEPFFSGTRDDASLRGTFTGIDMHNFTPANVAFSILEGMATSMHNVYQSAGVHRPNRISGIAMAGNCVRENPLLVKAVEEKFGVPAFVSAGREEAATGAAIIASRMCQR